MTDEDEIWNRALDYDYEPTHEGDRALRDVLLLDGMAQNGGLLHAVEGLEPGELEGAVTGFRWLGLTDLADGIAAYAAEAGGADAMADDEVDAFEGRGDDLYYGVVNDGDDDVIGDAFRRQLIARPEAFAPLR